jgi:hypothetical protein
VFLPLAEPTMLLEPQCEPRSGASKRWVLIEQLLVGQLAQQRNEPTHPLEAAHHRHVLSRHTGIQALEEADGGATLSGR